MIPSPYVVVIGGTLIPGAVANRMLRPLAQACGAAETDLIPLAGLGLGHIESTYKHTLTRLQQLDSGGKPLIIIAHSQGALIGACYAVTRPHVQMIALGAPWSGLDGLLYRVFGPLVPCVRDMRSGSMRSQLEKPELLSRIHSIYSVDDRMVRWRNSVLAGADNHCLVASQTDFISHKQSGSHDNVWQVTDRIGHDQLLLSQDVRQIVAHILADITTARAA